MKGSVIIKAIYYGEIHQLKPTDIDSIFRKNNYYGRAIPSIEELKCIIENPDRRIIKITEMVDNVELYRKEVNHHLTNEDKLKINSVECKIKNIIYNVVDDTLLIYTDHIVKTLDEDIDELNEVRDKILNQAKDDLEWQLKMEQQENVDKKRWYEFWK